MTTKNIKIKEKIEMKNNMVICWRRDIEQGKVQWGINLSGGHKERM